MNAGIERIKQTRSYLLDQIKDLSLEQLNKMPEAMNNNIAWHFGHLVAAQQGVAYKRAGLNTVITDELFAKYKPGTKPERDITSSEWEELKSVSTSTLGQFETDYENNLFSAYTPFVTRYGVSLANIDDAIQFLAFHEGYHSGCISLLKKLVMQ